MLILHCFFFNPISSNYSEKIFSVMQEMKRRLKEHSSLIQRLILDKEMEVCYANYSSLFLV